MAGKSERTAASLSGWPFRPTRPVLGELDQGLVFTGARADEYVNRAVCGLAITARCDVAQVKTRIFSYLPVVSLADWWQVDGAQILQARALEQEAATLGRHLRNAGHSDSILATEGPLAVVQKLFSGDKRSKFAQPASDSATKLEKLRLLQPVSVLDDLRWLCREYQGLRRSLEKELFSQRLTAYYFLPQVEFEGDDDGFVVLLREVHHLPRAIALGVASGLPKPLPGSLGAAALTCLSFDPDDFAMAVGLLPSPLIEHVMQSFAHLFTRIGLEDLPKSYLESLWDRLDIGEGAT